MTKVKQSMKKNGYEARFEQMVGEYHSAKAILDAMKKGTPEYNKQEQHCNLLFSNAESFFKQHL